MAYNEEVTMMMSVVPGSLTGISAMMGGLASITNVFTDITRQVDATFGLIDTSIMTASTIVAQFAIDAAKAAGEFEQGLKVAQMVSGQTAQEMDILRNKANELSVSFRTDIDQITEGLQTLGRAGLNSAYEQTEVLENGLSTAKLEGRELNSVLEELIQNTALLGGNLKSSNFGEDSQYVNDLLVATSMTAPITTHDVSETLKYSGGIAAAAGARIRDEQGAEDTKGKEILEDYMGAIAAFAQKGVTGSIAGTALRAFFNKPATQDSSVTEALASIHLKPEYLWEDDEETMKPVSEQIAIIKNQMDNLNISTMDQLQIWSKIVGGKMGQQMMKLDSKDIKELTSDIRAADDAGSLAAGTFQTFQSKMKEMTEQGQVAFRQYGEYAARYLTPLLEVLKKIFEFLSNPITAGLAFAASLSLITAAISRIKNLFSLLSKEFQIFHDFLTKGDKLMAVRPSTVRKNERFKPEQLERKYPGQSLVDAYSKEKKLEAVERLQKQGYSLEEIDILRNSGRLGKGFVNKSTNIFNKEEMFPDLTKEQLSDIRDSTVIKTLIDNKAWEEKYTQTFYEYGGNLNKVLEVWGDEINRKIFTLNNKKLQEDYKRIDDLRKNTTVPNKKNSTNLEKEYSQFRMAELENEKRHSQQAIFEELQSTNFIPLHEMSAFNTAAMNSEIEKRTKQLLATPNGDGSEKTYARNNVEFDNIKSSVRKNFVNSFVNEIEGKIGSIGLYMGEDNKGYNYINLALDSMNLLPKDPVIATDIQQELKRRGLQRKEERLESFLNKFEIDMEEGETMHDTALLSQEDFQRTIGPALPSGISYNELQNAMLQKLGIFTPSELKKQISIRRKDFEGTGLNLLRGEEFLRFFDLEDITKVSGWEDFMNYDPFDAANKNEKAREKNRTWRQEADKLAALQNDSADYWTYNELKAKHNQLDKSKTYMKKSDIVNTIKDLYGVTLKGDRFGSLVDKAYPYLADWSLTSHEGGMTNDEFAKFARSIGNVDVSGKNREEQVKELNRALYREKAIEIIEKENKAHEDLKNRIKELSEKVKNLNKVLDEISGVAAKERAEEKERNLKEALEQAQENTKNNLLPSVGFSIYGDEYADWAELTDADLIAQKYFEDNLINEIAKKRDLENRVVPPKQGGDPGAADYIPSVEDIRQREWQKAQYLSDEQKRNRRIQRKLDEAEEKVTKAIERSNERFGDSIPFVPLNELPGIYETDKKEESYYQKLMGAQEKRIKRKVEEAKSKKFSRSTTDSSYDELVKLAQENIENGLLPRLGVEEEYHKAFKEKLKEKLGLGGLFSKISNANLGNKIRDSIFTVGQDSLFGTAGERSVLTKGQKLGNMFQNVTNLLGGPFMFALEAVTVVIQTVQQAYQDYIESLKKAEEQVSEAFSKVNNAENSLRRVFEENNPEATKEEIDNMVYDTYETMAEDMNNAVKKNDEAYFRKLNLDAKKEDALEYDEEKDDGSLKKAEEEEKTDEEAYEEAIKENTGALYEATAQLNVATSKLANEMLKPHWGIDSGETWFSDMVGGTWDKLFNSDTDNFFEDVFYMDNHGGLHGDTEQLGATFSTNNNEFLLTDSQKDENYQGYTEMAGLMLENLKDTQGNWVRAMRTMLGRDVELLNNMIPQRSQEWMKSLSMSSRGGLGSLDARTNARLQTSMKNDTKTWKKLAREYAKRDVNAKQGRDTSKNVKRIRGLTQRLSSQVGSGFKANHAMQAAYLVQMQEMYKVAQNTMVPLIDENTQLAGNQLLTQAGIQSTTGNTADNAGGTWGTAEIISGLVAIIAKTKAAEYAHQVGQEADPGEVDAAGNITRAGTDLNGDGFDKEDRAIIELAQSTSDYKQFQQKANKDYYQGRTQNATNPGRGDELMAPALFIAQMYGAGAKMTGYDYDAKTANESMQKWIKNDLTGKESLSDIYGTLGKNYTENEKFHQRLIDNYINATEEDEGDGSGGGGGGGGGGNSGDKDNTGNKKERVDLVLCNKKEIPKLNVNLFKKPPTFTVLNKNFKLRDVKINTHDKPKAIMASIKNAFIDVQKRSDPKIIQDEEAEYDPVGATDGNSVPSGSSTAKTDSKKNN